MNGIALVAVLLVCMIISMLALAPVSAEQFKSTAVYAIQFEVNAWRYGRNVLWDRDEV